MLDILHLKDLLESTFPDHQWSPTPNPLLGIFSSNKAFSLAKETKQNPGVLAQALASDMNQTLQNLKKSEEYTVVATGPYLNLKLSDTVWTEYFHALLQDSTQSFKLNQSQKKLLLEYVSPNVAKPMHLGHMKNANLGEALRRILLLKYPSLMTDNHWGDWGIQFGIMLWAWKIFLEKKELQVTMGENVETVKLSDLETDPIEVMVRVYVWGNQQKEGVENWDQLVREEFIKLEAGDAQNRELWKQFVEISKTEARKALELLNVPPHTVEQGESFYEQDMKTLQTFLDKHQIWKSEEKARFFDYDELSEKWQGISLELKEEVKHFGRGYLISSQGYTTYLCRDIAARWQWARDHEADITITVTDKTQKHNFDQTFAALGYLATLPEFREITNEATINRLKWENFVHVGYGYVTLPEGKMSTRKGIIVTVKDLLQQIVTEARVILLEKGSQEDEATLQHKSRIIAIAALKWFDLARDSASDLVLDIKQILNFEGNTGVYQLYTLARLNSIIEKAHQDGIPQTFDISLLNEDERTILQSLASTPLLLEQITQTYKPHLLSNHLYDLAAKINSWYGKYSVQAETNPERKQTLVNFCRILARHHEQSLHLLAIDTLQKI